MDYQDRFVQLVKDITRLQWVRESLPSHSKYYESLKKKLEKQTHLKVLSENELKEYQQRQDKSVRFYDNAIQKLQFEMQQAKEVLQDLNTEKRKLDHLCDELHLLYDQIIIEDPEDATFIFGQHLKRDVEQLAADIPNIKKNIEVYKIAQAKLYEARELIESAMRSLPGAASFMDRQAIASKNNKGNHSGASILGKRPALMVDTIKQADNIAQRSYQLVAEAASICPDVPNIPSSPIQKNETNVVILLTNYRGYRLKVETILRTQVNPRLHGYENQLASAKYHYEQRVIEWIDHQIITLEAYFRANGCLLNDNLNREISMLRMGSRAARAAVASGASERVTVDDVLEISAGEGTALPEYAMVEPNSHSVSSSSNSSSHTDDLDDMNHSRLTPDITSCVNTNSTRIVHNHDLPSYTFHEHPPAYSA
ncbi:hypothetical protein G6F70_006352 [Rhizopus microsporus]|nr:hypothetical protein G6F71_006743 [Rhizopus microsporus]KAG1197778.1 hypothetical protein G6F70_006352 [Rhizopus microsporus]KAG1212316.1 hypothetical protein G6F69_003795 [Rhizopus microsporus]KAG1230497.1 hypothetical protein G6F67_006415 [Rhizopus microsporus]KAG1262759.1 hypothetical protein G6F68_005666 [Rhizopus microsporus]